MPIISAKNISSRLRISARAVSPATVNVSAVVNGGVPPYTISWNFGDGTTGSGASVNHTFSETGTFTISVNIIDSLGVVINGSTSYTVTQTSTPSSTQKISYPGTTNMIIVCQNTPIYFSVSSQANATYDPNTGATIPVQNDGAIYVTPIIDGNKFTLHFTDSTGADLYDIANPIITATGALGWNWGQQLMFTLVDMDKFASLAPTSGTPSNPTVKIPGWGSNGYVPTGAIVGTATITLPAQPILTITDLGFDTSVSNASQLNIHKIQVTFTDSLKNPLNAIQNQVTFIYTGSSTPAQIQGVSVEIQNGVGYASIGGGTGGFPFIALLGAYNWPGAIYSNQLTI